jgi:hypothetical protein
MEVLESNWNEKVLYNIKKYSIINAYKQQRGANTMTTITIPNYKISEFMQESCTVEVESFNISNAYYSFEWSNQHSSGGNVPEVEYSINADYDYEYEIDLCDIKEHTDLVEEVEELHNELEQLREQLVIANQVIAEYANAIQIEKKSIWSKLFSK